MRVSRWLPSLALASALFLAACGAKTVPAPVATAARYPDFIRPIVPPDLAASPAAQSQSRAWQLLQAGDLGGAERESLASLALAPQFYPASITQAYVELARRRGGESLSLFDRALSVHDGDLSALVGRGQALLLLDRPDEALTSFETAVARDATLTDIARRIDVLRLQVVQRQVTAARQATGAGRFDDARRIYREALERSPESGFLHREFADVERAHGDGDVAIEHYRRAATLDTGDTDALAALAEMLDARNDFDAALRAYDEALAAGAPPDLAARRDALRLRAEVARLPVEYRNIETAAQLTRGDLAGLIGLRLPTLLTGVRARDIGVITDIRGHWAESWILAAAGADYMEVYDNHTFQPRTPVRRADFAQVVFRLLKRLAVLAPRDASLWQNASGRFPDLAASHVAHPAASAAVAASIMTLTPAGEFQPARIVTGAEAVESVRRLRLMAETATGTPRP